jgi:hypothetical protein
MLSVIRPSFEVIKEGRILSSGSSPSDSLSEARAYREALHSKRSITESPFPHFSTSHKLKEN